MDYACILNKKGKEGFIIKSSTYREEVRKEEWARFEPCSCRILTLRDIIWKPNSFDVSAKIFRSIYTL